MSRNRNAVLKEGAESLARTGIDKLSDQIPPQYGRVLVEQLGISTQTANRYFSDGALWRATEERVAAMSDNQVEVEVRNAEKILGRKQFAGDGLIWIGAGVLLAIVIGTRRWKGHPLRRPFEKLSDKIDQITGMED